MRAELCEGIAELSAEMVERTTFSAVEKWQEEINGEILANGEFFMECAESGKHVPLAELQSLLHRQTEVARAVADQEESSWKMMNMLAQLTKVIAEQEHVILTLQQERTGAERMAAEISMSLRSQYAEISKLKQRYDSAEEHLSTVQDTVRSLQNEVKLKEKLLVNRDSTIQELKQRLAKRDQPVLQNGKGVAQIRQDREKRLAEIRSILSRSNKEEGDTPLHAKPSPRIEVLRAARDLRLKDIRGILQKAPMVASPEQNKSSEDSVHYDGILKEHSVSSTSEESMSDMSSLGSSSDNNNAQRHRLFGELVRQRQQLRQMP